MSQIEEPPLYTDLVDTQRRIIGKWFDWLLALRNLLADLVQLLTQPPVMLTNQTAAIASTNLLPPQLQNGIYRITYALRVTAPDGVSSSVTVTFTWTDGGVACSVSGAALIGDTTATTQSGTIMVRLDKAAPIKYSTAYASNTPNKMNYQLIMAVELIATT